MSIDVREPAQLSRHEPTPGDRTSPEHGAARMLMVLWGLLLDADVGGYRATRFPARAALTLLGEFGFTPNAIRMALARQVRRGELTATRVGRSVVYELTDAAVRLTMESGMRVRAREPFSPEAAVWTLVSFSVAEPLRELRSRLRVHLVALGFRPLRDGLWVALGPDVASDVTRDLDSDLAAQIDLDVFVATTHLSVALSDFIRRVWDIPALRAQHEAFLARWERFEPDLQSALPTLMSLVVDWVALMQMDPGLPAEPLGADWPSARSAATARRLFATLQSPAGEALKALTAKP